MCLLHLLQRTPHIQPASVNQPGEHKCVFSGAVLLKEAVINEIDSVQLHHINVLHALI